MINLKVLLPHLKLSKNFVNRKKTPIIPLLLLHDKFVTSFGEKPNIFNDYSTGNANLRPMKVTAQKMKFFIKDFFIFCEVSTLPSTLPLETSNRLTFGIRVEKISKIILTSDQNTAHG